MMLFGVNSDPSVRVQKRSIRVRVSSFRTAGTVERVGPNPVKCGYKKGTEKTGKLEKTENQETLHKSGPGLIKKGFW